MVSLYLNAFISRDYITVTMYLTVPLLVLKHVILIVYIVYQRSIINKCE